jgi:DNA-binding MarR family transcriptional regulator
MDYTDILINLRKILRSINLESKRIQKEYGISIPQYLCLNYLNQQEQYKSTAKQIKEQLNLNASTVSGIVSRLELKGYVAKLPNAGDRRSTDIFLTAMGQEVVSSIPDLMHEKLSRKLKDLPEKELENVQNALDILIQFMEVEDVDASPLITPDEKIAPKS